MSFIHVPSEVVRYRFNSATDEFHEGIPIDYILDKTIERQSVSKIELDIPCSYILNRYQLLNANNMEHANPGIAFLWRDERIRRSKLAGDVPNVEVPESQERLHAKPTDSDNFHRTALAEKLSKLQEMNCSGFNDTKLCDIRLNDNNNRRTFNLQKLLANSVYASECDNNEVTQTSMMNASFVEADLPYVNRKFKLLANETIVDDDVVKSLSQQLPNLDETCKLMYILYIKRRCLIYNFFILNYESVTH